jgi:hypothetical protein
VELRQKVYLWGNTVILASLRLSLQSQPQFEVTNLVPPLPNAQELATLNPEVIIFDLEAARPKAAFSLLEACPDLILVGVSPDTNLVKIWAGLQVRELSTEGLLDIINQQLANLPIHRQE